MAFIFDSGAKATLSLLKEAVSNRNLSDKDYFNIVDQLCEKTESDAERQTMRGFIIKQLNLTSEHWIEIYKTLKMICYLVKGGSIAFVQEMKYENERFEVLSECKYSTNGVENIKEKAKYIYGMLSSDALLKMEREKYKVGREKEFRAEQLAEGGLLNSIGRFTFDHTAFNNKSKYDLTKKVRNVNSESSSDSDSDSAGNKKKMKNSTVIPSKQSLSIGKTNANRDLMAIDDKPVSYVNNSSDAFDLMSFNTSTNQSHQGNMNLLNLNNVFKTQSKTPQPSNLLQMPFLQGAMNSNPYTTNNQQPHQQIQKEQPSGNFDLLQF